MDRENLTNEQYKEIVACKTPEEILALVKDWGYALSDEELDEIVGGSWISTNPLPKCPECGSYEISIFPMPATGVTNCVCHGCGYKWNRTALG